MRHLTKLLLETKTTHPSGVQIDQQKQAEEAFGTLDKIGVAVVKTLIKDPVAHGCKTALWAAASPEVEEGNVNGQYIVPDKKATEPSSQAKDPQLAERLWALCESILKRNWENCHIH